jgi:hypothetical protein
VRGESTGERVRRESEEGGQGVHHFPDVPRNNGETCLFAHIVHPFFVFDLVGFFRWCQCGVLGSIKKKKKKKKKKKFFIFFLFLVKRYKKTPALI